MKKRQIFNERGMTLVELLAALGLFTVVIALASTVIVQLVGSKDITSGKISLNQSTNILASELRSDYYEKIEKANSKDLEFIDICFGKIDGLIIDKLWINDNLKIEDEISSGCINNISTQDPISMKIQTKNYSGQSITINSTFENLTSSKIELDIKDNKNEDNEYIPGELGRNCVYDQSVIFKISTIDRFYHCNITNGDVIFHNENIDFINKGGLDIIVENGDISFNNDINFKGTNPQFTELSISSNKATFNGSINFNANHTEIHIVGDVSFNEEISFNNNHTTIVIDGNVELNNRLKLNKHAEIKVINDGMVTCGENFSTNEMGTVNVTKSNNCPF